MSKRAYDPQASIWHWRACALTGYWPTLEQRMRRDLRRKTLPKFEAEFVLKHLRRLSTNTLAEVLARANLEYWTDSPTILTDPQYDSVVERLREVCPEHPQLSSLGEEPNGRCLTNHEDK